MKHIRAATAPVLCCHRGSVSNTGHLRAASISAPRRSFVNRSGWREFQTVLTGLRRDCPPALPVVVRASWLPKTVLGQRLRRDERFAVLLNDEMGEPAADAEHVFESGLHLLDDRALWARALAHDRIVVSTDEDYLYLTNQPGDPGRLLWVRLGNCRNDALIAAFSSTFDTIVAAFDSGQSVIDLI